MTLTQRQRTELERTMTRRREALEAESHADAQKMREDVFSETAGPGGDLGDEATADLITDVENAELERDLAELQQIDAALVRLREGRYGQCVHCGREIEFQRLRREPAAIRCFECQSSFEKTFAHPGQPSL